jgi:hypothetical protein
MLKVVNGLVGPIGRRSYEAVVTAVLVGAVALYAGRAVSDYQLKTFGLGHGSTFVAVVIAGVAMVMLRAFSFAGFIAVATLATLNGIPGIDVESFAVPGSFRVSDVAVIALMFVLGTRQDVDNPVAARALRLARGWSMALVAWWLLTWIRSVAGGIPAIDAALFGRDFLYFAILVPLAVGAFSRRKDIYTFLGVLGAGTVIYAIAQIAVTGLGFNGHLFVHETISNELGGLHRVYTWMDYAVTAAAPIGLGLAVSSLRRSVRLMGAALALLSTVSVLLAFTRATYLGLTLALLVVSGLWIRIPSPASVALKRISLAGLAAVLALIITGGVHSLVKSGAPAQAVASRASATIADLQSGQGTVQYRYDLTKRMRRVLGSHWVEGLGFLHPDDHPVASLPSESIRNTDVGVLNSIMTMGLVGTFLLYGPPLAMLFAIFRARVRGWSTLTVHEGFFYGMSVWLLYLVISSVSLVTLFSVPCLVLTALLLGCAARLLTEAPEAEWSPQS